MKARRRGADGPWNALAVDSARDWLNTRTHTEGECAGGEEERNVAEYW